MWKRKSSETILFEMLLDPHLQVDKTLINNVIVSHHNLTVILYRHDLFM